MTRLMDEINEYFSKRGVRPPGALREVGVVLDLLWGMTSIQQALQRAETDPAFVIEGYTREIAVARIDDEIRYCAGKLSMNTEADWYKQHPDEARLNAVRNESTVREVGHFETVEAAGAFAEQYLTQEPQEPRKPPQ